MTMPPPGPEARLQRLSRHLRLQSHKRAGRDGVAAAGGLRGVGCAEDTKSTQREYDGQAEEYANVSCAGATPLFLAPFLQRPRHPTPPPRSGRRPAARA